MISEGSVGQWGGRDRAQQVRSCGLGSRGRCWCWAGFSSFLCHSLDLSIYGMVLPLLKMALSAQFLLLEGPS